MRKHGRIDSTQAAIVGALRACGAQVLSLADVGGGCPDLLVLHRGRYQLVECKARGGTLTDAQASFHRDWLVSIIDSVEGAVALLRRRE